MRLVINIAFLDFRLLNTNKHSYLKDLRDFMTRDIIKPTIKTCRVVQDALCRPGEVRSNGERGQGIPPGGWRGKEGALTLDLGTHCETDLRSSGFRLGIKTTGRLGFASKGRGWLVLTQKNEKGGGGG